MEAPLEDPNYEAQHPPVGGAVPDVIEKWGPRSQARWFLRFQADLKAQPGSYWERFWFWSEHHRGPCCVSCEEEGEIFEDLCCCKALREEWRP